MEDKISPCCPLCPLIVQKDVQQLAEHLGSFHKLENSGLILARTMWSSQVGYQGVVQVLKDVQEINRKLENMNSLVCDGQSDKHQLRVKHTEFVEDMKKKGFQDGEVKDIKHDEYIEAKTKVKLENIDVKKGSDETDVPNVIEDIVEVKQELIDYELRNEVERSEYSQPCYCERSDQILRLKEQVSCLVSQKNKLKSQYFHYFKLAKKEAQEKKVLIQQIRKQKRVQEKEAQKLKIRLQNQIILSPGIKSNDTNLLGEVEKLKEILRKKTEDIEYLKAEVNEFRTKLFNQAANYQEIYMKVLKEKLEQKDSDNLKLMNEKFEKTDSENIKLLNEKLNVMDSEYLIVLNRRLEKKDSEHLQVLKEKLEKKDLESFKVLNELTEKKNVEIYNLQEIVSTLDSIVKKLEKKVEYFQDQLFLQYKETLDLKHSFDVFTISSQETISDKDKKIFCLEKELEYSVNMCGRNLGL